MILEAAKKFREEARQAMIATRNDSDDGKGVDPELQWLLFQLLGALNHASHMITQVLARGEAPVNSQTAVAEFPEAPPAAPAASQLSALDRIQEYEPADAPEPAPRRRAPRGSFHPSREDLHAMRQNMTVKAIGEKYGVSMATVMNRLRDAGLTSPRETGGAGREAEEGVRPPGRTAAVLGRNSRYSPQ